MFCFVLTMEARDDRRALISASGRDVCSRFARPFRVLDRLLVAEAKEGFEA
jgi:hypothetical protein